jgi:hypothetical protein
MPNDDDDVTKPVDETTRVHRTNDAQWLKGQIEALAKDALDNAKEDRKEAEGELDDRRKTALVRAAGTAEHYARALQSIASGVSPDEALMERIRNAPKPARRRRR